MKDYTYIKHESISPYPARILELQKKGQGGGRFALPIVNRPKLMRNLFFSVRFRNVLANLEIVTEPFF